MRIQLYGRKPAAQLGFLIGLVVLLQPVSRLWSQPSHTRLIFSHSLLNATPTAGESIVNSSGTFIAGKGWQSPSESSQLRITLASPLPYEGTFIIDVTNFDPVSQNTVENKQHIINLYSRNYDNNKDIFDTDGSWCNIRTGSAYSTGLGVAGFKFLAASRGLPTRDEERCVESNTWSLSRVYQFKIIWTRTYAYCYLDGVLMSRLPFSGQIEPFKYLLIGRDNLIWGYSAQPGVIFSNVRIYGPPNPVVKLSGRLLLQGAYNVSNHAMRTLSAAGSSLPLQSPFSQAPYTVTTIPANIVDWVLVGLRSTGSSPAVAQRSVWLRSDGRLVDPQNADTTLTLAVDSGNYFVTVQTRNHLAAMTPATLLFDGVKAGWCTFTAGLERYYGGKGAVQVESGVWVLQAGDLNTDGAVNIADFGFWQTAARTGSSGYAAADLNYDSQCTTMDYVIWFENARAGAASGMP